MFVPLMSHNLAQSMRERKANGLACSRCPANTNDLATPLAWFLVPTGGVRAGLTHDLTQAFAHPRNLLVDQIVFLVGVKFDSVSSSLAPPCSLPDWVDMFPLHKFTCEGDVDGVRRCVHLGMSVDERDSDSWAPLHYACW